jgi:hypothetical protein
MKTFRSSSTELGAPGFSERSGEVVDVMRPLTADEVDLDEVGPMFRVRFADGVETDVFSDELTDD